MEPPKDTTKVLIARAKTRRELAELAAAELESTEAFKWLRHRAIVLGVPAKDASDRAQEAVFAVWKEIDRGADWIYREDITLRQVAFRNLRDVIRNQSRGKMASAETRRINGDKGPIIHADVDLAHAAEMTQAMGAVRNALVHLSPRERRVFELRAQDFAYEEIAEMLQIGIESVKEYFERAKKKLRKHLEAQGIENVRRSSQEQPFT
jgi:RNA polymerase sigma factor (sigma-70 family)